MSEFKKMFMEDGKLGLTRVMSFTSFIFSMLLTIGLVFGLNVSTTLIGSFLAYAGTIKVGQKMVTRRNRSEQ